MFQVCTNGCFHWVCSSFRSNVHFYDKRWLCCILMTAYSSHTYSELIIDLKLVLPDKSPWISDNWGLGPLVPAKAG